MFVCARRSETFTTAHATSAVRITAGNSVSGRSEGRSRVSYGCSVSNAKIESRRFLQLIAEYQESCNDWYN